MSFRHSAGRVAIRVVDQLRPAAQPVRPAVIRIGVGLFSAVHQFQRRRSIHAIHRQDPARFHPTGVVKVLKRPLPARIADALFDVAQLTNALTTLGVFHRVTGPLNAALQWWTISYRNSWGMIYHSQNMMLMHQSVLGISRSADALSVDAVIRQGSLTPQHFDRAYGGIPTAMNLATITVYFISGVAKVRSPKGWRWATGEVLRDRIAADAIRKDVFGSQAPQAAAVSYRSRAPFGVLAATSLAVELGAPLSLINRRAGQLFSVGAWGMHVSIRVIMDIKFRYNVSGVSYLPYWPIGPELPGPLHASQAGKAGWSLMRFLRHGN